MRSVICVLLAFLVLTFAGQLPFEIHDAAELAPICTLQVEASCDGFVLRAEHGRTGKGSSFALAVEDLKESTAGVVFLQTAQKIILTGEIDLAIRQIVASRSLRPSGEIFTADGLFDTEQLSQFLATRSSGVTLSDLRSAVLEGKELQLPRLEKQGERVELYE